MGETSFEQQEMFSLLILLYGHPQSLTLKPVLYKPIMHLGYGNCLKMNDIIDQYLDSTGPY